MASRRLVAWISTGILVFQGSALALDLLNCSAMGWLLLLHQGATASALSRSALEFCNRPQDRLDRAVCQGRHDRKADAHAGDAGEQPHQESLAGPRRLWTLWLL